LIAKLLLVLVEEVVPCEIRFVEQLVVGEGVVFDPFPGMCIFFLFYCWAIMVFGLILLILVPADCPFVNTNEVSKLFPRVCVLQAPMTTVHQIISQHMFIIVKFDQMLHPR
jgi:hypothetical protein